MKILFVSHSSIHGGAENVLQEVIKVALKDRNSIIYLVIPSGKKRDILHELEDCHIN